MQKTIVVMHGFYNPEELIKSCELQCQIVIHSYWQLEMLERLLLQNSIFIWVRINIDNDYIGFALEDVTSIYMRLRSNNNVMSIGILAHFIKIVNVDENIIVDKIESFECETKRLDCIRSLSWSMLF